MRNLPLLFCGIFFCLAFSWSGLILSSHIQLGALDRTTETLDEEGNLVAGDPLFPEITPGLAEQGKDVYLSMGCVYCHSQQVRRKGFGGDYERGWGDRASVPRDYIGQDRVVLGTKRTGPDLMTIGDRNADKNWHHLHLYNPQITSPGSTMPPFAFLYKVRKIEREPSPNALNFGASEISTPPEGYEVVPTPRAEALVEYLRSLRMRYSLPEARLIE